MTAKQSLVATTRGGVGQPGGSGWGITRKIGLLACSAAVLLLSVGCMGMQKLKQNVQSGFGMYKPNPAAMIIATVEPTIHHLPDPSREGEQRPGLAGGVYLLDSKGHHTELDGDLKIFIEDMTPRLPGEPVAVPELWHFDAETMKSKKTHHEKFGQCYLVFLPWPDNWRGVKTIRVSTEYEPSATNGGPKLTNQPQIITLDYNSPGQPVWKETNEPMVMRGIPNLKRDLAQGGTVAPHKQGIPAMTQPNQGTVLARQQQQSADKLLPQLPPTIHYDPNKPVDVRQDANGKRIHTSAFALPPGESIPPGWTVGTKNELVPVTGTSWMDAAKVSQQQIAAQQQIQQTQQVMQQPSYGSTYVQQPGPQAGYVQQQPLNQQPGQPVYQPQQPVYQQPMQQSVQQPIQQPMQQQSFDPNSTTGAWANSAPLPPVQLPPMNQPPVIQPTMNNGVSTVTIPASRR